MDKEHALNRADRLRRLRSCVLRDLPRARTGSRDRNLASQRAKNAILALGFVLEDLADENTTGERLQRAIRAADAAYRATVLRGESFEKHAAMEMVAAIRGVAADVLEGRVEIENINALPFVADFVNFPGSHLPRDQEAFREAVRAWVTSERAMRKRGRREGRTPDRWGPTFECLKRFGLQNGISTAKNLKDTWGKSRPHACPLSDE